MTRRDIAVDYSQANFASRVVHFLLFAALVLAPGFLGGLAFFFVGRAFTTGVAAGFRSFAAVILPLMVLTFLVLPRISRGRDAITVPKLPM
jgi:hypothetical protein